LSQFARRLVGELRRPHCDVARKVAVLGVARTLESGIEFGEICRAVCFGQGA
jgi:hypothetical protein